MESTVVRWTLLSLIVLLFSNLVQSQGYIPYPDCNATAVNASFVSQPGHCTWYGQCVENLGTGGMFNCYYNGPAKNVSQEKELLQMLNETCPWYVKGVNGHDTKVCCDVAQLNQLKTQTGVARSLFSRCPACIQNFMKHFCFTTCDPDMSLYIEPFLSPYPGFPATETVMECTTKNGTNVTFVEGVHVVIDDKYGQKLFNSCANVQYPEQSGKVISLMCGNAKTCTAKAWLEFLGDPALNYNQAPFKMVYTFTDSPPTNDTNHSTTPFNTQLTECDADSKLQCSCSDCPSPKLCPPLPEPTPTSYMINYIMFGVAGFSLLLTVTCFLVTMSIAIYTQCSKSDSSSSIQNESYHDDDINSSSSTGSVNDDVTTNTNNTGDIIESTDPLCGCCDYIYSRIGYPLVQVGAWMEFIIKVIAYHWGIVITRFWFITIPLVLIVFGGLSVGVMKFEITTDTVKLWSAPNSQARLEKNYFDEKFGPFYRTEQIIIQPIPAFKPYDMTIGSETHSTTFGPVFNKGVLLEVLHLQNDLSKLIAIRENGSNVTLGDICFKPLYPDNQNCTIQSIMNYFQNNLTLLLYNEADDFDIETVNASSHINYCTRNPTATKGKYATNPEGQFPCLAEYGGPIDPNTALGGFPTVDGSNSYNLATTIIITFIVNNHVDDDKNKDAAVWETEFLNYLKNFRGENITISYMAQRSITDEIKRESSTDELTIIISYLVMFLYIAIFLGKIRSVWTILIDLKIVLGVCGVIIVLLAVAASVGFLSLFNVEGSLIILEVVPFLVLAVGVDNLFILVHSYERQYGPNRTLPVHQIVARALAEVAPSLILTATSESAAFLLGAISTMPAVRTFSLYAGVAVFFNFCLQISAFVSVMYLDAWRTQDNRIDVLWFIQLPKTFIPEYKRKIGYLNFIVKKFVSPVILYKFVRPFILLFFGLTFTASLVSFPWMKVGLDQNLALPKDSYLQDYFHDLYEYLHIGPPVYFVIKDGVNYTSLTDQDKVCSGSFCDKNSVGTQLAVAARAPNVTRIAEPGSIWLDAYYEWLDPSSTCCGHDKDNITIMCDNPTDDADATCVHCLSNTAKRPTSEQFLQFLQPFFTANPTINCAAAGHAAYNSAVVIDYSSKNKDVKASYIMTYHSICSTSDDFISALKEARTIATNLTTTLGVEVFPYSVFYVYYDQYLHIGKDMLLNIGVSIGAVFIVATAMLGLNVWGALMVIITVIMILVHLIAAMVLFNINANAVSLVNLVMTVGIAVEFSAHIVRWFVSCKNKDRVKRARSALNNMGSSVISGITITKFLGVFILVFAKSQLFFVYYFGMYMSMVIIGALHGLIFLPVFLSYFGPPYVPVEIRSPYPVDPSETRAPPSPPVSSQIFSDEKKKREDDKEDSPTYDDGIYPILPSDVPQDYGPPTYSKADEKTPLLH